MRAYVVRLTNSAEIVGIFTAASLEDLRDLVDEVTDPNQCDYAVMGRGGIVWPSSGAATLPLGDDVDALAAPHGLTEQWSERLSAKLSWGNLVPNGHMWSMGLRPLPEGVGLGALMGLSPRENS